MSAHDGYARRPLRTSQAEPPRDERIVFSRVPLRTEGLERTITGLHRGHDRPVISIQTWGPAGRPAGRTLLFSEQEAMVQRAVDAALEGRHGKTDGGRVTLSDGTLLACWAYCAAGVRLIGLGRMLPNGEHRGGPTTLREEEIPALAEALRWLRSAVSR